MIRHLLFISYILLFLASCEFSSSREKTIPHWVSLQHIEPYQTAYQEVILSETVKGGVRKDVFFERSGRVQQLLVEAGQLVEKGQLLGVMTLPQNALGRFSNLPSQRLQLEKKLLSLPNTESRLSEATASPKEILLYSPVEGLVLRKHVRASENVAAQDKIYTLVSMNVMQIPLQVQSKWFSNPEQLPEVQVRFANFPERSFVAQWVLPDPMPDPIPALLDLMLDVDNQEQLILSGMQAKVVLSLPTQTKISPSLPLSALIPKLASDEASPQVWVYDPQTQMVSAKDVVLGKFRNNEIEIKAGIDEPTWVVIEGGSHLYENSRVRPRNPPEIELTVTVPESMAVEEI